MKRNWMWPLVIAFAILGAGAAGATIVENADFLSGTDGWDVDLPEGDDLWDCDNWIYVEPPTLLDLVSWGCWSDELGVPGGSTITLSQVITLPHDGDYVIRLRYNNYQPSEMTNGSGDHVMYTGGIRVLFEGYIFENTGYEQGWVLEDFPVTATVGDHDLAVIAYGGYEMPPYYCGCGFRMYLDLLDVQPLATAVPEPDEIGTGTLSSVKTLY